MSIKDYRIGYGEDIHRLVPNRKLILSGVKINFDLGLYGHSDADVVYHAVSDAILGALALGDLGKYFPPNDPKYDNYDSLYIVKDCLKMAKDRGYKINNVDVMILAEEPKLSPFILEMRHNLALALQIEEGRASIKAGTNEGMDAVGGGKAIMAKAVISLIKED